MKHEDMKHERWDRPQGRAEKPPPLLAGMLARPDLIALTILLLTNGVLWVLAVRGLAFLIAICFSPIANAVLLLGGLFATLVVPAEPEHLFARYMKIVIFGPPIAAALNFVCMLFMPGPSIRFHSPIGP